MRDLRVSRTYRQSLDRLDQPGQSGVVDVVLAIRAGRTTGDVAGAHHRNSMIGQEGRHGAPPRMKPLGRGGDPDSAPEPAPSPDKR